MTNFDMLYKSCITVLLSSLVTVNTMVFANGSEQRLGYHRRGVQGDHGGMNTVSGRLYTSTVGSNVSL